MVFPVRGTFPLVSMTPHHKNENIKSTTCDPPNLTRFKEQSIKDSEQTTIDEKTHTPIIQNM